MASSATPKPALFCDKHIEPVTTYCKTHDVLLCTKCEVTDHIDHVACVRQDLDGAVAEKKQQLITLDDRARDTVAIWRSHEEDLSRCVSDADQRFQAIKDEINTVISDEIKQVKDGAITEAALINNKADDEIRRINAERETRLKNCDDDAEKRLRQVEDKRQELLDDLATIDNLIGTKIGELRTKARDMVSAIEDSTRRIETLIQDDKKLFKEALEVITSLSDTLENTAAEDDVAAENIPRAVESVKFIKGVGNEKYNGRICGLDGKLELADLIQIPDEALNSNILECLSDVEILLTYYALSRRHTYKFHLKDKTTQDVITTDESSHVVSCARLDRDTLVCGMKMKVCSENSLDDCIRLYNKQWEVVKTISIPRNTPHTWTRVDIAVDREGMIIAAEMGQSNIYVINPEDGGIVNTIQCGATISLCGALSTGDVVAKHSPRSNKILILNRNGGHKEVALGNGPGEVTSCKIDSLTDDIYPMYIESRSETSVVAQLSGRGEIRMSSIFEFRIENNLPSSLITPSGKLILCDSSKELRVFKKKYNFPGFS